MFELMDLVLLGLVSSVVSAFVGVLAAVVTYSIRNRDVSDLYRRIESMEMSVRGQFGNEKKAEKTARMEAAMLEAGQIMQDSTVTDKKTAIMGLIGKYPDIAMSLAKKHIGL